MDLTVSTDFTIELSNWAMSLESMRAQVASENIANANISGVTKSVDFESLISSVTNALDNGDLESAQRLFGADVEVSSRSSNSLFGGVSLDSEVADLSSSQGRYKVIADALSRKFGLMLLSSRGQ